MTIIVKNQLCDITRTSSYVLNGTNTEVNPFSKHSRGIVSNVVLIFDSVSNILGKEKWNFCVAQLIKMLNKTILILKKSMQKEWFFLQFLFSNNFPVCVFLQKLCIKSY